MSWPDLNRDPVLTSILIFFGVTWAEIVSSLILLMKPLEPFLHRTRIAYFSMEIALRDEIHTFSGGLGVLAGDTARSSADLELPIVFVSLMSRQGYVRQEIDAEGRQKSFPNPWDPRKWMTPLGAMVVVPTYGRDHHHGTE